ncbi:DUF4328 domain-containing protein [Kribbella sp. NBC_01245]|uniref:DUF4328 domain-containing protein n=1 Tax=Kribbella sp. NBC_01245 TaxID=2903578 RepID=UPI002E281607|nr:DUF4328 domain-containing protein [Kribbella sp. NBC_01245]
MSHPHPAEKPAEEADEWQPHAPETFQQIGRLGQIAIGLLGLSILTRLLSTWSDWNSYDVVARYLNGSPGVEDADINRADNIARLTSIPNIVIAVAAAVVFVLWLWRARVNSEVFCQADHRHSHGWVLISWFCPGPNLWYPRQIVEDVWVASDPATPAWAETLRSRRPISVINIWWYSWLATMVLEVAVRRLLMSFDSSPGLLRMIAISATLALVLSIVSAFFAAQLVRKLTAMQVSRPWESWWDQREPSRLSAVPAYSRADSERDATAQRQPVAMRRSQPQPQMQFASAVGAEAPRFGSQPGQGPLKTPLKAPGVARPAAAAAGSVGAVAASAGMAAQQTSRLAAVPAQPPAARPAAQVEAEQEEAPAWSPFAPVVEAWKEPEPNTDVLGSTAGYAAFKPDAYTPESQQSALGKPLGDTTSFMPSGLDATLPSWGTPIAPITAPVTPVPPVAEDPLQPTWKSVPEPPVYHQPTYQQSTYDEPVYETPTYEAPRYDEPTYETPTYEPPALSVVPPLPPETYRGDYSSAAEPLESTYLPPSRPIPTPDPIETPVRRSAPGRRAAAVAVDSPSSLTPAAEPEPTYEAPTYGEPSYPATSYGESTYREPLEQAPLLSGPPPAPVLEDDYLTPSQPLPPVPPVVPAYEPEPTYTPSYSAETYSYGSEASGSSYDSYESYGSGSSYSSSAYESDYSDYSSSYSPEPAEPVAPPAKAEPTAPPPPEKPTTPRVHPRRRWA